MGGKITKRKACTKNCPPKCEANPKNHIPHEHLIVAFSALVIALSGVILGSPSASAAPIKAITQNVCKDSDKGKNTKIAGTTTVTQTNYRLRTTKVITTKKDGCKKGNIVVEYSCNQKTNTIVTQSIPCSRDEICQEGACIPRNILPTKPTTPVNTSTEYTSNLSLGQPALSGYQTATDGSWCQVHSTSTALSYCEDSRGVKIYSSCDVNLSKIPMCGSIWSGTSQIYLNTKCVFAGYECSEYNATCAMNGNTASCINQPTTPVIPPDPSTNPNTTPTTQNNSLPAVRITAETPTTGTSDAQAILANTQIGRFRITNYGTSKITVKSLNFIDSGTHTGNSTTFRLYYSDQNSQNFTANTAVSSQTTVGFNNIQNGIEIDGNAFRYVTISIQNLGQAISGDTFQLSSPTLGSAIYSVTELDLGYDANQNGSILDIINNLKIDGNPTLGTLIKR